MLLDINGKPYKTKPTDENGNEMKKVFSPKFRLVLLVKDQNKLYTIFDTQTGEQTKVKGDNKISEKQMKLKMAEYMESKGFKKLDSDVYIRGDLEVVKGFVKDDKGADDNDK